MLEDAAGAAEPKATVPAGSLLVSAQSLSWPRSVEIGELEWRTIPGTLRSLRELVRECDSDVLLVSRREPLTRTALGAMLAGLAADSSCATVSLDGAAEPSTPGLPPPATVAPRPGAVLVRRDHLIHALDEADVSGWPGRSVTDGFIAWVLATLARPGFVHRAVAAQAEAARRAAAPRVSLTGRPVPDVVLDGRCLGHPLSGTQVQLFGLAGGLARLGARVAVLCPDELHPSLTSEVARLAEDVPFIDRSRLDRPAIFHRPYQVWSLPELADCLLMGERLVLTHQDMILDRTPAYAASIRIWQEYRATTEAAFSSADEVGFFSYHAAVDAASDGALELDRATVIPLGVDHLTPSTDHDTVADPLSGRPYLLVLGNTYWHKNRLFALRLVQWLVEREGWEGGLVLAGGDTGLGSSLAAEQAMLHNTPSLRDRVVKLEHVTERERSALYRGAELVLFPSMYEGFGLIPFEAAVFGTASVYTYRASMRELLPEIGALPSFDIVESGQFVSSLLGDAAARDSIVTAINDAAKPLTWERTAAGYLEVYGRALASEPRTVSRALVGVGPLEHRHVSEREARLLDVYGRRKLFRVAVEGAFGVVHQLRRARTSESRDTPAS